MYNLSECTVLIVDDIEENIDILVETLGDDYELIVAMNGEDALQLAKEDPPDLILLDIMMPGMDGYEVLSRLKNDPETRDIGVIFVTAMSEIEDEAKGLALGAVDYITKPISPPIVKARVATHLKLRLAYQILEKQRDTMQLSIDLASEIQKSLLPGIPPEIHGLDIAGRSLYCDETGGDYFDYLIRENDETGRIAVAVGDVSGHGLASALLMTTARALLRQRYSLPGEPAEIVADVNRHLSKDVEKSGLFVTLFFCEIDRQKGTARWVRAGHEPGLLFDANNGSFVELDGKGGMPLGIMPGYVYVEDTTPLSPGQILAVGTDGIWETQNPSKTFFGKKRFKEIIRDNAHKPAAEIIQAVNKAVDEFRGTNSKTDDVTLVIVKIV